MRLVILGGGGFRVPLVHAELLRRRELGVTELVLQDVDAGRLTAINAVLAPSPWLSVRLTTSLEDAVRGADFVFSAIRVGGLAGRAADERRALDRGLLGQETVGAGGICYGLRTLPVALRIAATVAELAPNAWLINFTNPAGMITEASRSILGDRVIGICDSPVGLIRRACAALGAAAEQVSADYVGINHLGWLRGLRRDGEDLLPALLSDPARLESFEEGRLFGASLLSALGSVPNEYLYFYYRSAEAIAALSAGPSRGELLAGQQADFYAAALADPSGAAEAWQRARRNREESYLAEARPDWQRDEQDLVGGGYEQVALELMQALSGGPARRLIVNVANGSTFSQLPPDLIVEVPCQVDRDGARPLPAAGLELHQLGLISSVRAAERAAIEAVRTGSRELALRSLVIHPLVGSAPIAVELLDDLLARDDRLSALLH